MAEFAYNNFANRTTGLSAFEILTGFKSRQPINLVLMAHHYSRGSNSAPAFASHIHALHEKIRDKIMKNNVDYKAFADLHRRLRIFNIGDYVMVRPTPERFSPGTVKKLNKRSIGPCKSLR